MRYAAQQVWFPLSEDILGWDYDFHQLMLNDHVRMSTFEQAIKQMIKPGMTVADIGTGTGILALWALQSGAKRVYGIDVNASILEKARERIAEAGYHSRYTTLNALSYNVQLHERVDVIISELLGNLADNEDMTPILEDARKRFLKPGGQILPRSVTTFLVPVEAIQAHAQVKAKRCQGVNTGYNLDQLMEQLSIHDPFNLYYDAIIPCSDYLAQPQEAVQFHFRGDDQSEYETSRSYSVLRAGLFTGFKGYFVADLGPGITLDISNDDIAGRTTSDCWKHCYLPIRHPFEVEIGDLIMLTYRRFYPTAKDSPFRQCYAWFGTVSRRGDRVHRFAQSMNEARLE